MSSDALIVRFIGRGRARYFAHTPRARHLLLEALGHPAAASLAVVTDRWIPPAMRANPQGLTA
jgi:hypothetical protein